MDFNFWAQEWPLISNAPHLAIGGAIGIALVVWTLVSSAHRRRITRFRAESGAWETRFSLAREREAVVSQKRYELEATVQILNNQITASAPAAEIASTTQRVTMVGHELAFANSALSEALRKIPVQTA
jgi:hypothetical protein